MELRKILDSDLTGKGVVGHDCGSKFLIWQAKGMAIERSVAPYGT